MTKVLLFGASGFIGRHVLAALAASPSVTSVTCTGRDRYDLMGGGPAGLADLLREVAPDAVVNCTGRLGGTAEDLVRANTATTAKLVDVLAATAPHARFVRLGSAAEYGPVPAGRPVREADPAIPASEYGVSHLAGTRLVALATAAGRIDGIVLRVFNPIGAGLHEDNMLGRATALLRQALDTRADHITLGPLTAYRDFVDVRDVASAVLAAILVTDPPHRVFNVASGVAVSAREVVQRLAAAGGFTGEIRETAAAPARSAAVTWIQADIGRAADVLSWRPTYDLTESVKAIWTASDSA